MNVVNNSVLLPTLFPGISTAQCIILESVDRETNIPSVLCNIWKSTQVHPIARTRKKPVSITTSQLIHTEYRTKKYKIVLHFLQAVAHSGHLEGPSHLSSLRTRLLQVPTVFPGPRNPHLGRSLGMRGRTFQFITMYIAIIHLSFTDINPLL